MTLDLRNNTITVGELLDNRASRSVETIQELRQL